MSRPRSEGDGLTHDCPIPLCYWPVWHDRLMCPPHWNMVPLPIRHTVWQTWDDGKGAGTAAHLGAMQAAIGAVRAQVGR